MSTLFIIVTTMGILMCCFCLFMLHRNNQVYKFRQELLEKLHVGAEYDIKHNQDWLWRHRAFDMVSYNVMCNKFWLKLAPELFWEDTRFLEIPKPNKEATWQQ